jgi:hypothetical protein
MTTGKPSAPGSRLLLPKELRAVKGIPFHLNHLRRLWRKGCFPVPIQLSAHRIAFCETEVDDWITARKARR